MTVKWFYLEIEILICSACSGPLHLSFHLWRRPTGSNQLNLPQFFLILGPKIILHIYIYICMHKLYLEIKKKQDKNLELPF